MIGGKAIWKQLGMITVWEHEMIMGHQKCDSGVVCI